MRRGSPRSEHAPPRRAARAPPRPAAPLGQRGKAAKGETSMSTDKIMAHAVDRNGSGLYRVGGICALLLGAAYVTIIPLYVYAGAPPNTGEAWLTYLAGKT